MMETLIINFFPIILDVTGYTFSQWYSSPVASKSTRQINAEEYPEYGKVSHKKLVFQGANFRRELESIEIHEKFLEDLKCVF